MEKVRPSIKATTNRQCDSDKVLFLARVHLKISALVFKFILYQFRTPIAIKSPWHEMLNVSSPAFQVNTVDACKGLLRGLGPSTGGIIIALC